MSESDAIKIREAFSILTQGIEITQYDVNVHSGKQFVASRILWLDSDMYRICIDTTRPTVAERLAGKIPPGLYLRDICEVRPGHDSVNFRRNNKKPTDADHCLSLIGTEKSYSIEFPSKFSRDWFHKRFILLVDDVLSPDERSAKRFRLWAQVVEITQTEIGQANQLQQILQRGIRVIQHCHTGESQEAVLRYQKEEKMLTLTRQVTEGIFVWNRVVTEKMDIDDISEIRVGCHSFGFVRTNNFEIDDQALSIISSSWVFDLELIDKFSRDLFVQRLHRFLLVNRKVSQSEADYLSQSKNADQDVEVVAHLDEQHSSA